MAAGSTQSSISSTSTFNLPAPKQTASRPPSSFPPVPIKQRTEDMRPRQQPPPARQSKASSSTSYYVARSGVKKRPPPPLAGHHRQWRRDDYHKTSRPNPPSPLASRSWQARRSKTIASGGSTHRRVHTSPIRRRWPTRYDDLEEGEIVYEGGAKAECFEEAQTSEPAPAAAVETTPIAVAFTPALPPLSSSRPYWDERLSY